MEFSVEDLDKMASGTWIPKIKAFSPDVKGVVINSNGTIDIGHEADFRELFFQLYSHHVKETEYLMAVIKRLALEQI